MNPPLPKSPGTIKYISSRFGYSTKPSFLIFGVQKGGTTSLFNYLKTHPNIKGGVRKEIHFFAYDNNFRKGKNWYHSFFPYPHELKNNDLTFEASPDTIYLARSYNRLLNYNPSMKILIILRDPVERAWSAWNHYRSFTAENLRYRLKLIGRSQEAINSLLKLWKNSEYLDFSSAIDLEFGMMRSNQNIPSEPALIRKGLYINQIKTLFDYFPKKQILIIDNYDLENQREKMLDEIIEFLCLPKHIWPKNIRRKFNKRAYPDSVNESESVIITKKRLSEFYKPYDLKLIEFLNKNFSWVN